MNHLYLTTPLPTKSNSCNLIESFNKWEELNISYRISIYESDNIIKKRFLKNGNMLDVEIKIDSIDSTITLYEYNQIFHDKILKIYAGNDILEIIECIDVNIFSIISDILSFKINIGSEFEYKYHDIRNEFFFTKWWKIYFGEVYVSIEVIDDQHIMYFIEPDIENMTKIKYRDNSINLHSNLLSQNTYNMEIFYI